MNKFNDTERLNFLDNRKIIGIWDNENDRWIFVKTNLRKSIDRLINEVNDAKS